MRCAQPCSWVSSSATVRVGRSRASTWVCARDGPRSEEIDSGLCVRSSPLLGYAHESDLGPKQSTRRIERQRSKDGWVPDRSSCTYRMRCAGRGGDSGSRARSSPISSMARPANPSCGAVLKRRRREHTIAFVTGASLVNAPTVTTIKIAALVIGPNPAITLTIAARVRCTRETAHAISCSGLLVHQDQRLRFIRTRLSRRDRGPCAARSISNTCDRELHTTTAERTAFDNPDRCAS